MAFNKENRKKAKKKESWIEGGGLLGTLPLPREFSQPLKFFSSLFLSRVKTDFSPPTVCLTTYFEFLTKWTYHITLWTAEEKGHWNATH